MSREVTSRDLIFELLMSLPVGCYEEEDADCVPLTSTDNLDCFVIRFRV